MKNYIKRQLFLLSVLLIASVNFGQNDTTSAISHDINGMVYSEDVFVRGTFWKTYYVDRCGAKREVCILDSNMVNGKTIEESIIKYVDISLVGDKEGFLFISILIDTKAFEVLDYRLITRRIPCEICSYYVQYVVEKKVGWSGILSESLSNCTDLPVLINIPIHFSIQRE
ncbi:MAG: hypothetical protein HUJ25_03155 [Crocinitomicaceae bacterium]|nr:hypothetical protein [Crocinitomicaceae bacterium]